MKVIIDTNVLISGIFFKGAPYQVLKAWRDEKIQVVISTQIIAEYRRVAELIGHQYPGVELTDMLYFLFQNAELVEAPDLPNAVCVDPDDDKFLACALASGSKLIISGDKHLLALSGYQEIEVIKPKNFLDKYLM